jgi:hypothetical protein
LLPREISSTNPRAGDDTEQYRARSALLLLAFPIEANIRQIGRVRNHGTAIRQMQQDMSEMDQNSNRMGDDAQLIKERVQELTWALVDESISVDELPLLESLLLSDDAARGTYVRCMQLHSDLLSHFAGSSTTTSTKPGASTQVLGHLNSAPLFNLQSPTGDEALQ